MQMSRSRRDLMGESSGESEAAKLLVADLKSLSIPQEQKEKVAQKIAKLAESSSGAACLRHCGVIPPLVAVLRDGTDGGQREASSAIAALAAHGRDYRKAVTQSRPVAPLVAILKGGSNKAATLAAAALATLSAESEQALAVIREGGPPGFMRLLRVGTADAQAHGAMCVAHLSRAGSDYGDEEAEAQPEAHAIRQLVTPSVHLEAQNDFSSAGAIPLLLAMLQSGKTQTAAAHALSRLAAYHEQNQSEIAKEGGVAPLLALLHGANVLAEVRETDRETDRESDADQTIHHPCPQPVPQARLPTFLLLSVRASHSLLRSRRRLRSPRSREVTLRIRTPSRVRGALGLCSRFWAATSHRHALRRRTRLRSSRASITTTKGRSLEWVVSSL